MLSAVANGDYLTVGLVAAGVVVGIVTFAQILSRLLKRYPDATLSFLTGMMLGSSRAHSRWYWRFLNSRLSLR